MWYFGDDDHGEQEEEHQHQHTTSAASSSAAATSPRPPPPAAAATHPTPLQEASSSPTPLPGAAPPVNPSAQPSSTSTSTATLSAEQLDQDRETIRAFLRTHKCYDLMPVSGKIVVLDTALPVKAAFTALIDNDVKSAPLWDSETADYVGMITVSDFRNILRHFHSSFPGADLAPLLEEHEIRTWRRIMGGTMSDALITVRPEESLHAAALALLQHRIHRLPIMDPFDRTILHIITHRKINNFLIKNLAGAVGLLGVSIEALGIGTFSGVITVTATTPVIGVLDLLASHNISAVPVVDERGVALGVYANSDIVDIARRRTFDDLNRPVSDILLRRSAQRLIHSCRPQDTLQHVLQRFHETKVHRLLAVDEQERVVGIVSLSDILKAFLTPPSRLRDASSSSSLRP